MADDDGTFEYAGILDEVTGVIVRDDHTAGLNAALRAIASIPAPDSPDQMNGHEDAYRAVEALLPEAPCVVQGEGVQIPNGTGPEPEMDASVQPKEPEWTSRFRDRPREGLSGPGLGGPGRAGPRCPRPGFTHPEEGDTENAGQADPLLGLDEKELRECLGALVSFIEVGSPGVSVSDLNWHDRATRLIQALALNNGNTPTPKDKKTPRKTKWRLTYWHRDQDRQVTEGFHSFEDMATRKARLQQSGMGWNFEETIR